MTENKTTRRRGKSVLSQGIPNIPAYVPASEQIALASPVDLHELQEIHISDIGSFLGCRRLWNWTSRLRGNLEPSRPYHAFFTGSAIHYALERHYGMGEDWRGALAIFLSDTIAKIEETSMVWEEDRIMMMEQTELVKGMLDHYFRWESRTRGPFSMENLEWITTEQNFMVPIVHPITGEIHSGACYAGKIDGLVRRRDNGQLYIWETKTARSVEYRVKMLSNDLQATAYYKTMREIFGTDVAGLVYTIMAKRVPPAPKVLKNGMLSTDLKSQTLDSYGAAIYAHHTDATKDFVTMHYGTQLFQLHNAPNTHFQRHIVLRNEPAVQQFSMDLWNLANIMTDPTVHIYPTPGTQCSYCLYYDPCIMTQNGENAHDVLAANYRYRVHDIALDTMED